MPVGFNPTTVCVTGGTGYIAGFVIQELLEKGHVVHTTVRSIAKSLQVPTSRHPNVAAKFKTTRHHLLQLQDQYGAGRLRFFEAELDSKKGWREAVAGCRVVMHVASPFTVKRVKDPEAELIRPAVAGVLNVFEACAAVGVEHVVLTSSIGAINDQGRGRDKPFTEKDWNTLSSATRNPYYASKAEAERAAWKFVENRKAEGKSVFDLTAICPGAVCGPQQGVPKDVNGGYQLLWTIMDEQYPGLPRISMCPTDVRDVAHAHVAAMERRSVAAGKRYIICERNLSAADMAAVVRANPRFAAYKIPSFELPDFVAWSASYFDANVDRSFINTHLGPKNYDTYVNDLSKRELGMEYRTPEQTVIETVEALCDVGLLKDKRVSK
ncbi:hypothetical protein HDU96_000960 [Phlyctochytrium bullatum]|nr:hypothetical protein HDU96_000960 [Phlyctochytrium bullatum]